MVASPNEAIGLTRSYLFEAANVLIIWFVALRR